MYDAYTRIFTRTGLTFRAVRADSGAIGGDVSQEFHVLADSGEDAIVFSDADDYAANLEVAAALPPSQPRPAAARAAAQGRHPGARTIADLARFLKVEPARCVKTLIVDGSDGERGGARGARRSRAECGQGAEARRAWRARLRWRAPTQVLEATGDASRATSVRSGLKCRIYADHSALALADFVCGANEKDLHLTGVNWDRDVQRRDRRRPAQRRRGRSEPVRPRRPQDRPRHRGRTHLPARQQVQRAR